MEPSVVRGASQCSPKAVVILDERANKRYDYNADNIIRPRNLGPIFQIVAETENSKESAAECTNGTSQIHQGDYPQTEDSDCDSVKSVRATHGKWEEGDEDVPFNGCICGEVHARPTPVFWIQCEGPCQAWYNVTPACVGGLTQEKAASTDWNCCECDRLYQGHRSLRKLMDLPPEVLFRILEFIAMPFYRAPILQRQIAGLCRAGRHFVKGDKSRGIWGLILQRDYIASEQTLKTPVRRKQAVPATPTRSSKRRRKSTDFLSADTRGARGTPNHDKFAVEKKHLELQNRTDEAYMAVEQLADPLRGQQVLQGKKNVRILTLQRLRQIIQKYQPIDLNRPSSAHGRTFLQVCCAAEINEAGTVRCVRYLVDNGADPNILSTGEQPFANRPAIFFAISRAMPHLLETLIEAGAFLDIHVSGDFRQTFSPGKVFSGTFTPLEYAREFKRLEIDEAQEATVPPYWVSRVSGCIRKLEQAVERANAKLR